MTSFITGDGQHHDTVDAATTHASQVHARTGNIIAVEEAPLVPPATLNGYTVIAHKPHLRDTIIVLCVERRRGRYEYVSWRAGRMPGYVGRDGDWVCEAGDYKSNLDQAVEVYNAR